MPELNVDTAWFPALVPIGAAMAGTGALAG